jgi:hypothetical protein
MPQSQEILLVKFEEPKMIRQSWILIINALYQLQVVKGTKDELYAFAKRYPKNIQLNLA